ncbi:MAG: M14 family metallopeptidase [marine benthic group bacterium]|nr:M14 family metallopeptidase [Gemmatimonadota bacterium]
MRSGGRLALLMLLTTASGAWSQSVPSPSEALGYDFGARFTDASDAVRYAELLAAASSRVRLVQYGRTPEGRPLTLLVIASDANSGRIESLLQANARLTDPDLSGENASAIARTNPAIAWFTYGVHGDESASTEAALWTAYDLAVDAEGAAGILDSLVVVIDPMANPDGRDRYVQWYRGTRGATPNPDPSSREHKPPWPGGRYNHYLFDLNRDWTWATQAETRARLDAWQRWNPQVHVDFHEMGYSSSYFFFPAAEPINPIYPDYTVRWAEYFGRANAAEFDRRRWLYYTGETFDMFYPGFGDSWPSLVGAIGMTYEQAGSSRAGLVVRRPDGTNLTLEDRATHHRVAGLSTLRAAAARKTELLTEFAGFHRSQGADQPDVLLVPGPDASALRDLAASLQTQGVRVERATRPFRASASPHPGFLERDEFPVGTFRVRARQPRGRLAVTLLQPETSLGEDVTGTYDITAWSLPYAYGVEAHSAGSLDEGAFEALPVFREAPSEAEVRPGYGWLVLPSFRAAGPLLRHLEEGGRAFGLRGAFEQDGVSWPAGTVFVPGDEGAAASVASAGLADVAHPVGSGSTSRGHDLGTGSSITLQAERIGVLMGRGFSATSAGAAWYLLEVLAGIPFDALDAATTSRSELAEYGVLVVPSGSPRRAADDLATRLREWVEQGGTMVTLGSSTRWAAGSLAEIDLRAAGASDLSEEERRRLGLRTTQERRSDAWDDAVTGIILPLTLDEDHPLAWGAGSGNEGASTFTLHLNDLALEPSASHETVASFGESIDAVSGVVSEDKLEEIAASTWLSVARVGSGKVIMFADDPLFRLMWPANFVLFTNALLYGPRLP